MALTEACQELALQRCLDHVYMDMEVWPESIDSLRIRFAILMYVKTHLPVLEESVETCSTCPVSQLPIPYRGRAEVTEWRAILYAQFKSGVKRYGRHWAHNFAGDGLPHRSVVGVWYASLSLNCRLSLMFLIRLSGLYYYDTFGVTQDIFHCSFLRLPNPEVNYERM